jgi:hypothetical protein
MPTDMIPNIRIRIQQKKNTGSGSATLPGGGKEKMEGLSSPTTVLYQVRNLKG